MTSRLKLFLEKYRFTKFHHLRYLIYGFTWFALYVMCSQRVSMSIAVIGFVTNIPPDLKEIDSPDSGGRTRRSLNLRSDQIEQVSERVFSLKNIISSRSSTATPDKCPNRYTNEATSADKKTKKVYWRKQDQELAVGLYTAGYLLGHLPGVLVTFYTGIHILMIIVIFSSSLLNLLIIWLTDNYPAIVAIRIAQGFIMGGLYPAINQAVAVNSHKDERHLVHMVVHTANFASSLIMFFLGGLITEYVLMGYVWILASTAIMGFIAGIFWTVFCWSEPSENPFMSRKEIEYVEKSLYPNGKPQKRTILSFPWGQLLMDPVLYCYKSVHAAKLGNLYMQMFGALTYYKLFFRLGPFMSGVWGVFPFMGECIVQLSYPYFSKLILPKNMPKSTERKLHTLIGAVGCSFFLFLTGFIGCENLVGAVILQTISLMFVAPSQYGYFLGIVERYGPSSGVAFAIINIAGSAAGLAQRSLLVFLMNNFGTVLAYQWSFILTAIFSVVLSIPYFLFGSVDQPSWVHGKKKASNVLEEKQEEEKVVLDETADCEESEPEIRENEENEKKPILTELEVTA